MSMHKKISVQNNDSYSDEEITSYQVPGNNSHINKVCTPVSPPICPLPSSLQSSLKGKKFRFWASEEEPVSKRSTSVQSCSAPTALQTNFINSLGMNPKEISWVSSMESLVADVSPRLEFNTIERATFLPASEVPNKSQIQRRALFPSTSEDSLGLQPLDDSFESNEGQSYSREMRLSDVCDILKTLNVKSTNVSRPKESDCYDFDVGNTLIGSPSLFSPMNTNASPFIGVALSSRSPVSESRINGSQTGGPTSQSNFNFGKFSPRRTPSPVQLHTPPENSFLEIPLEETPKFKDQHRHLNIPSQSAVGLITNVTPKSSQACGEEKKGGHKGTKRERKALYGSSIDVTPFEASDIDDILKALEECENAACQFFSHMAAEKKVLPKTDDLMPFNKFVEHQSNAPLIEPSLKRAADAAVSDGDFEKIKKDRRDNSFKCPIALPNEQMPAPSIKLVKSSWNSKIDLLVDSQAEVTDTQIFQVCEEVESSLEDTAAQEKKPLRNRRAGIGFQHSVRSGLLSRKKSTGKRKVDFSKFDVTGSISKGIAIEDKTSKMIGGKLKEIINEKMALRHSNMKYRNVLSSNLSIIDGKNETQSFESIDGSMGLPRDDVAENKRVALSPLQLDDVSVKFVGFTTGSNKVINPKDESLKRVRKMFEEDVGDKQYSKPLLMSIDDRNLKSTLQTVNQYYCADAKDFFFSGQDTHEISTKTNVQSLDSCFVGFRTCNNKIIKPSKDSLTKVKSVFDGCNVANDAPEEYIDDTVIGGFPSNNISVKPSEDSMTRRVFEESSQIKVHKEESLLEISSPRSCTGSGSIVKSSQSSVANVERIFEESDLKMKMEEPITTGNNSFVGFRTGNNRLIKPSEASVKKVQKLLKDCEDIGLIDSASKKAEPDEPFMGFQTGNNQFVKPSEASLNMVKGIFESTCVQTQGSRFCTVEKNVAMDQPFLGFQTGNSRFIKPSSAALRKVKVMFDNIDADLKKCDSVEVNRLVGNPQPQVFKSEVLNTFDGTCTDRDDLKGFIGFQTGNNKFINPSVSSLAKMKKLFDEQDLEIESDSSFHKTVHSAPTSKAPFLGFCTGNNNLIKPSEKAFESVRKMFQEEGLNPILESNGALNSGEPHLKSSIQVENNHNLEGKVENNEKKFKSPANILAEECNIKAKKRLDNCNKNEIFSKPSEVISDSAQIQPLRNNDPSLDGSKMSNPLTSILDESYSTLLENTDWDDTIVPTWLHISPNAAGAQSFIQPARKRSASPSDVPLPSKRSKNEVDEIIEKRREARIEQSRMHLENKGKAKPIKGSYILRKENNSLVRWQDLLPKGPENVQYENLKAAGIEEDVLSISADTAREFRFMAQRYFSEYDKNTEGFRVGDGFMLIFDDCFTAGYEEFENAFLAGPGVDPALVPAGWVHHHYGLIVWKLACYQRTCFTHLRDLPLNPHNVMLQLKYRYDREIDRSESSALKRILERDDAPGKAMVLTVLRVSKLVEGCELLLSDGWYTCPARTDCALDRAINGGKIKVGTKIMTQGAELVGCDQGAPPLDIPKGAYLKISTNSVRRVRWYRKMGFQNLRFPLPVSLRSILPHGGLITCVRVGVVRVYPLVYVEKTKEGSRVTRNSKAERRAASLFQQEQESRMEQLHSQIQREMSIKSFGKVRGATKLSKDSISNLSAEEISDLLENAADPFAVEALLSEEQKCALWKYQESCRIRAGQVMQQKMEEQQMHKRDVRSVLRVRLIDLNSSCQFSALLSWWQPSDELLSVFVEGRALALYNILPGNSCNQNQIYLNSSRHSRIDELSTPSQSWPVRHILRVDDISAILTPIFGEMDVVGLVVYTDTVVQGPSVMQTVYLTDTGQNFFGLVFWRGLQEYCCEDTLAEGLVICASNVQWRRASATGAIPSGFVTETTSFLLNSRLPSVQNAIDQIKQDLEEEDIPSLIEKCQDAISSRLHLFKNQLTNCQQVNQNVSLKHLMLNVSDQQPDQTANTSVDFDAACPSPQPRPRYLNGFAQKPQASSTPLKTKTPIQRRIGKLQQIGEPPPLSPIPVVHGRRSSRAFKPPLSKSNSFNR